MSRDLEAEERDRLWWEKVRRLCAEARERGESFVDLTEIASSAEGQMALALIAGFNAYADRDPSRMVELRQRRIDSPGHQKFLLGRYAAWRLDGGRPADRPIAVERDLDLALVAVANRAAPWELGALAPGLGESREGMARRLDEYYRVGDGLLDADPSAGELKAGEPDGPGLPRWSWVPAPPEPEPESKPGWAKISEETAPAPKMGG